MLSDTRSAKAALSAECAVETSTPTGEAMANMLATFAQFERYLISQRTKEHSLSSARKASGSDDRRPCRSQS